MKMQEWGAKLKKIRLEKGLTIEDVHKGTKIHANIIRAIEGDSLTDLSPVYLKGFVKIYCKFLGFDPAQCLSEYKESVPAAKEEPRTNSKSAAGPKINYLLYIKKALPIVIPLAIFIVFVVGLFKLGKFIASRPKRAPVKVSREVRAPVKPAVKKEVAEKTKSTAVSQVKEELTEIILGIKAKENCLVTLKVDGRLVFHRVLEKGRFEAWQANDKIEMSLSNAGGVELQLNGQVLPSLGRKKQAVKNIVITKNGLTTGKQ